MKVPDANHPIWPIIRVVLLVVALGLCLKFNYTTFDPVKDPRAMLIMAILAGGVEWAKRLIAPTPTIAPAASVP